MADWIDPRTDPSPPYRGPERLLARDEAELAGLTSALKDGRLYDAEGWVRDGRPLQSDPRSVQQPRRRPTPLGIALKAGQLDAVRLLLCNGYRTELEPSSPLNTVLETRRWDLLELLLEWGADPHGADVCRILDTYQTAVFERFQAAGVDLTAGDAMADALAGSTRNRPLYGFARAHRQSNPSIQRALDVGLGVAIRQKNDKAVSLCLWAGANPRRRVARLGGDPAEDEDGLTALEQAVCADAPRYLKKLGFDPAVDDMEPLYRYAWKLETLRFLVAIRPPKDWPPVTMHFLSVLSLSLRLSMYLTGLWEVEQVFALGGRLGALKAHEKRDLRRLLLTLDEYDAKRLFRLLASPAHMERSAFLDLIAHPKLAERYANWTWHAGAGKDLWVELAATPGIPASVRRMAKARLKPPAREVISHASFEEAGVRRIVAREELYHLVWSQPMTTLAARFGLSDNGLRKRCRAMDVPWPPRGYWQQVRQGKKPRRTPLPPGEA